MKKKVLFIDRDGTLIYEPPVTYQVDNLLQLKLLPGVIRNLYNICTQLDYELVMVTNQDGLGSPAYPLEHFETVQHKLLELLEGEGIVFQNIHIDTSFEHEKKETRKPGTGMLTQYLGREYDLENSYVIGDRLTDVLLAQNMGSKAIFIINNDAPNGYESHIDLVANNWDEIYRHLRIAGRTVAHSRETNETDIKVVIDLDGTGEKDIKTGLAFFDHMLEQIAQHGQVDLAIKAAGDLQVDEHHTIEDTAITLGEAIMKALGDKKGIERYGFCLPMDDCLAQVAVDFGGRPWLVWDAEFKREYVGDMPTEMFYHFFKSFSDAAKCNLNIQATGTNEHHKIEAIFKAFARCIKMAVRVDINRMELPTTKGAL